MDSSYLSKYSRSLPNRSGFSLIEVVLAIGIFLITILALVGLLGPTLRSVDEVEKVSEVVSVVDTVNAFLQTSPDIAASGESKFDTIYNAVREGDHATIFVFKQYTTASSTDVVLQVGFVPGEATDGAAIPAEAKIPANPDDLAGAVYRVVLSPSSALPAPAARSESRTNGVYSLATDLSGYAEGYFAMEVRIFAEDRSPGFDPATLPDGRAADLANLSAIEPIFTYNTAIVR